MDIAVGITDKTKLVEYYPGNKLHLNVRVGDEIPEGGTACTGRSLETVTLEQITTTF